jgi:hypothetical protein
MCDASIPLVLGTLAPLGASARPVCPYPQLAKYEGQGDEADAASWRCVE